MLLQHLLLTLAASNHSFAKDCLPSVVVRGKYHKFQHIYISTLGSGSLVNLLPLFTDIATADQTYSYSIQDRCRNNSIVKPSMYLFCTSSSDPWKILEEVDMHISEAKCQENFWNPHSRTVLIIETELSKKMLTRLLREIFSKFWSHIMYNVAVMVTSKYQETGQLFIANPFHRDNNCGKTMITFKVVKECSKKKSPIPFRFLSKKTLFPNCSVNLSVREEFPFSYFSTKSGSWKGSDMKLLKHSGMRIGLKFNIISRPSREKENNFTETNEHYDLLTRNDLDLAIGGLIMSSNYYYNVTYLKSHSTQYLSIFVASRKVVSRWHVFHLAYSKDVWIGIILIFLICSILYSVNHKYAGLDGGNYIDKVCCLLGVILQAPQKLPQRLFLRFFFGTLILSSYLLTSLYSSNLHGLTVNPPYTTQISSMSQLKAANYSIWMNSNTLSIVKNMNIGKDKQYILNHAIVYKNLEDVLDKLELERNFAILERNLLMDYIMAQKGYTLYKLSYVLTQMNVAFVVPKGSLFSRRFDVFITRCVEHGLNLKWLRDLMPIGYSNGKISLSFVYLRALTTTDLYPAFLLLAMGLFMSFSAFIAEIMYHRYKTNLTSFENPYEKLIRIFSPSSSSIISVIRPEGL